MPLPPPHPIGLIALIVALCARVAAGDTTTHVQSSSPASHANPSLLISSPGPIRWPLHLRTPSSNEPAAQLTRAIHLRYYTHETQCEAHVARWQNADTRDGTEIAPTGRWRPHQRLSLPRAWNLIQLVPYSAETHESKALAGAKGAHVLAFDLRYLLQVRCLLHDEQTGSEVQLLAEPRRGIVIRPYEVRGGGNQN
jgi:hypothetical protein